MYAEEHNHKSTQVGKTPTQPPFPPPAAAVEAEEKLLLWKSLMNGSRLNDKNHDWQNDNSIIYDNSVFSKGLLLWFLPKTNVSRPDPQIQLLASTNLYLLTVIYYNSNHLVLVTVLWLKCN